MMAPRERKGTHKIWICLNFDIKEIFDTQINDYLLHSFNYTTIINIMTEIYKRTNPSYPSITRLSMELFFEPQAASQSNRVTYSRQRKGRQIVLKSNCRQMNQIEESQLSRPAENNKIFLGTHKNSWIIKNIPLFQGHPQDQIKPYNNNYKAFPRRSLTNKHSRNPSFNLHSPQRASSQRGNYEKIVPSCSLLFLNPAKSKHTPSKGTVQRSRSLRVSPKS